MPTNENKEFNIADYRYASAGKVAKVLRSKIDPLIFEVSGYGTREGLNAELTDIMELVVLIAHKKGVKVSELVKSIHVPGVLI